MLAVWHVVIGAQPLTILTVCPSIYLDISSLCSLLVEYKQIVNKRYQEVAKKAA